MNKTKIQQQAEMRADLVTLLKRELARQIPIFSQLMDIGRKVNENHGKAEELGGMMHGAIRVASPEELQTVRRVLAVFGLYAHNCYDLRQNVSAIGTGFRPRTEFELKLNGFRLFVSMLDINTIPEKHRPFVQKIINRRSVFSPQFLNTLESIERNLKEYGVLAEFQKDFIVSRFMKRLKRPTQAHISLWEYFELKRINKVAAQVLVCNAIPLNHLTPSVASVEEVQVGMQKAGIKTIAHTQGPIGVDVLLKQTSCLAPPVKLQFRVFGKTYVSWKYQETFIEFEERGAALTRAGRTLYDACLAAIKDEMPNNLKKGTPEYEAQYKKVAKSIFQQAFGQPFKNLFLNGYVYATFERMDGKVLKASQKKHDPRDLALAGLIKPIAITFEDFLPRSAEGIFASNIGLQVRDTAKSEEDPESIKTVYEGYLGEKVINAYAYYQKIQDASFKALFDKL